MKYTQLGGFFLYILTVNNLLASPVRNDQNPNASFEELCGPNERICEKNDTKWCWKSCKNEEPSLFGCCKDGFVCNVNGTVKCEKITLNNKILREMLSTLGDGFYEVIGFWANICGRIFWFLEKSVPTRAPDISGLVTIPTVPTI